MRKPAFLILFFLCIFSIPHCYAQNSVTGRVVVDSTQENARNFSIEILDSSHTVIESSYTDNDGAYIFDQITADTVYIHIPQQYGFNESFYANAVDIASATSISFVTTNEVTDIDFTITEMTSHPDSDSDGIRDAEEFFYGNDGFITDYQNTDSDNDGLSDYEEVSSGVDGCFTNPNSADTDGDTISDSTDPLPVPAYIKVISGYGLQNQTQAVTFQLRDLYDNLLPLDGIQFTVHCTGNALFTDQVTTGTLISGADSQSALVATDGGQVCISISNATAQTINLYASDSQSVGIMCFSDSVRFIESSIPHLQLPYLFIDTQMDMTNDFIDDLPIGFEFSFFDHQHTIINMYSNGFLTFDYNINVYNRWNTTTIPHSSNPSNMIAPFWEDLDIVDRGKLLYTSYNNSAGKVFCARWDDIYIYDDPEAHLTFDTVLFENSNLIMVNYITMQNGTRTFSTGKYATIGIENDGATDGILFSYQTIDAVHSGLTVIYNTQPVETAVFLEPTSDNDNDGLINSLELQIASNPLNSDTDGDGLPDKWEYDYNLNPLSDTGLYGAQGDFDNDGLINIDEYTTATYPNLYDSDGDGLSDGEESNVYFTDPTNSDSDNDSLDDYEELYPPQDGFYTDPNNADSDNDGISDDEDSLPVHAKLCVKTSIQEGGYKDLGVESLVTFHLVSLDGHLLSAVNDFSFRADLSGSAVFLDNPDQGVLLAGAETNSAVIQLENGEARVSIIDYVEETVTVTVQEIVSSPVRFPLQQVGYEDITYSFQDISSPSNQTGLDDTGASHTFDMGFQFKFYGESYSSVRISSFGYLTFSANGSDISNDAIPSQNLPNQIIAPFWDYLSIGSGAVYVAVVGDAPWRRFIVQWDNVSFFNDPSARVTFQVILYEEDSTIDFFYRQLNNASSIGYAKGISATVGIENSDGTEGVSILYNTASLSSFSGYTISDGKVPSIPYLLDLNADYDCDGLINSDELSYNTDVFTKDSDGDTFTDGQEVHITLTDPDNDASYLHMLNISRDETSGDMIVSWASVDTVKYIIYVKNNVTNGEFVILNEYTPLNDSGTSVYYDAGGDPADEFPSNDSIVHPSLDDGPRLYLIGVKETGSSN